MLNYEYLSHLDSTIVSLIEDGKSNDALETLNEVLELAKNSRDTHPCSKAEQTSEAYYNFMLFYAGLGDMHKAAEAAKEAFEYDHFLFNQYPLIFKTLLAVNKPEMDETAAQMLDFFEMAEGTFHGMVEELQEASDLCSEYADRSDALKWILQERIYVGMMAEADENPDLYDEALSLIDEWIAGGHNIDRCNSFKSYVYYQQGRKDKIVELWKDRSLKDLTSPLTVAWVGLAMIEEGFNLPDPIPLPDIKNVIKWSYATISVYSTFRARVANAGLTDKVLQELEEEGEDEKRKFFESVRLARSIAAYGLEIYDRFFHGEKNGTATSVYQYIDFLDTQGDLLGKTGDREAGMAILEKGMKLVPHTILARSITDLALDMNDGEKALKGIQWQLDNIEWQKENAEEGTYEEDWENLHILARLELWARGLTCKTYAEYLPYVERYEEKYKDMYTYCKHLSTPFHKFILPTLRKKVDEFFYACNNRRMVLFYFFEKEPENPLIIAELFASYARMPSLTTDAWIVDSLDLLDILRKDSDSEEGRALLCKALTGAGFLLSVSTEEYTDEQGSFIKDEDVWQDGMALLDEAETYATTADEKLDIILNKINLYRVVDNYEEVRKLTQMGLELIKDYQPKEYSESDCKRTWRLAELDFDGRPSFLFVVFNYWLLSTAKHFGDSSPEEIVRLTRNLHRTYPENPMEWYNLSNALLPFALKDTESPEFYECVHHTLGYLFLYNGDEKDEERAVMLYNLGMLQLAKGRLRMAAETLDELTIDYGEELSKQDIIGKLEAEFKRVALEFDNNEGLFSGGEVSAADEARERKEWSVAEIGDVNAEELALVETSYVARRRSGEEIAKRAITALKLAEIAHLVIFNWDHELFDEKVNELKEIGLFDYITLGECRLIEKSSDRSELWFVLQMKDALGALFWALGDLDELPTESLSFEQLNKLANKHIDGKNIVVNGEIRTIDEILDALDYSFRMSKLLVYSNCVLGEDDEDSEVTLEDKALTNFYSTQEYGLSWIVDASGTNCWDNILDLPFSPIEIYMLDDDDE